MFEFHLVLSWDTVFLKYIRYLVMWVPRSNKPVVYFVSVNIFFGNHTLDDVWHQNTGSPRLTHKQK